MDDQIPKTMQMTPQLLPEEAWQAHLQLGFNCCEGKTILVERSHRGPLQVQKPFYPEGGLCHVYLIHPPGGVVAGDRLHIAADIRPQAQVLLTTPAANKYYRSDGNTAQQHIRLQVAEQASLEWLPQESIAYQGAQLDAQIELQLAESAAFMGWEVVVLGRPAAGEGFATGKISLTWRIYKHEKLLLFEKLHLDAATFQALAGLQGYAASGEMLVYPATPLHLQQVQALIADHPLRGVTLIEDLLILRAMDQRADHLRGFFEQVWQALRVDIIGKPACLPRIWAT